MSKKEALRLASLLIVLSAAFIVIAVGLTPRPREAASLPTLAALPSLTPTDEPTAAPTDPPTPTETTAPTDTASPRQSPTNAVPSQQPSQPPPTTAPSATTEAVSEVQPTSVEPPIAELPPPAQDTVVITFSAGATAEQRAEYIASIGGEPAGEITSLNAVVVTVPEGTAREPLPPSPAVVQAEPEYYAVALDVPAAAAPNDALYADQWNLNAIGALSAWDTLPADAPDVIVAVIDSGVCLAHEDLQGRLVAGWDFVENDDAPQDVFGHGCGIAGIIAAQANNRLGIAGVTPNASVMPLRVLDSQGVGAYSMIAQAIVYAADHGAQVINLSLGGSSPSTVLQNALDYALERGVYIVAAAGNTSGGPLLYPAAYMPVIAVGSFDQDRLPSAFNPAGGMDVLAPGRGIMTLGINGSAHYRMYSGTSVAAPHAAGAIALEIGRGGSVTFDGGMLTFDHASAVPTLTPSPTAQVSPTADPYSDLVFAPGVRPAIPTLSSDLYQLLQAYRQTTAQALAYAQVNALSIRGGNVKVMVIAQSADAALSIRAAIEALGGEVTAAYQDLLEAWLPIDALEQAAALPGISLIRNLVRLYSVDGAVTPLAQSVSAQSVTSEGVAASNANAWHASGFTGSGITVAVIDTSFKDYTTSIANGDLPAGVTIYQPAGRLFDTVNTNHGTAVAEIVYDMAPGANLLLGTPLASSGDSGVVVMAEYINDLACVEGVNIIQSSMFYANFEAGDGTGTVSNAIAAAQTCGAIYVQAGGNQRLTHWDRLTVPSEYGTPVVLPGYYDEFRFNTTSSDTVNDIGLIDTNNDNIPDSCSTVSNPNNTFSTGEQIILSLRWNNWTSTTQDYDLYLMWWNGSAWEEATSSLNDQTSGTLPPTENITYVVPSIRQGCYGIAIGSYSATNNHVLDLTGYFLPDFQYSVSDRSLVDPATSNASFGVSGVNPTSPDYLLLNYSSQGPAHAAGGTINNATANQQPRLAGYANVTTGVGQFSGTSAAAPHAAGALALVQQAYPALTDAQARAFLEGRAVETPADADDPPAYDNIWGYGRLYLGNPPAPPQNTNLIQNGTFSTNGVFAPWVLTNAISSVNGGVLAFGPTSSASPVTILQTINTDVPANAPFELMLDMGSLTSASRSYRILVRDQGASQTFQCSITLGANAPMQTRILRFKTTTTWTNIEVVIEMLAGQGQGATTAQVDNVSLQYKPSLSVPSTSCSTLPPPNTNLIVNGSFTSGLSSWGFDQLINQVNNGVLEVAQSGAGAGSFFQSVPYDGVSGYSYQLTMQMGNSSATAKSVSVRVRSSDWSQQYTCNFTIGAGFPLQTYTMRFKPSTTFTSPMVFQTFVTSGGSSMALRVDNIDLQYRPSLSVTSTECVATPPANVNLVQNGDFSAGTANWTFDTLTVQVNSGVLRVAPSTGSTGTFLQALPYAGTANQPYELVLRIGNNSSANKTVNVIVRDLNWAEQRNCVFNVPPLPAMQTYTMRFTPSVNWNAMVVQSTITGSTQMGILVDDVNLQYKPSLTVTSTECIIAPPANTNLVQNGEFTYGVDGFAPFFTQVQTQMISIGGSNGNVYQLAPNVTSGSVVNPGGFYQFMPYSAPPNAVLEFTFQLGNLTSSTRVINMIIRNAEWTDLRNCFMSLPPTTSTTNQMRTYTMRLRTNMQWANIVLQTWMNGTFNSSTNPPPFMFRFDNLSVVYNPSSTFSGTVECPVAGASFDDDATMTPTPTESPTPTETHTPTATPTFTATATLSDTETLTATVTETPSVVETATETATPTLEAPTETLAPTDTPEPPTPEPPTPIQTLEPPTPVMTDTPEPPTPEASPEVSSDG